MLHIIIDTRESQAWAFPDYLVTAKRGTLPTADYALAGDSQFAIERKSVNDFVGTVSTGWARFCNELDRMILAHFPARIVIVEGTLSEILEGKYDHPRIPPQFVFSRIATLALQGVTVLFADNPISAAGLAYKILEKRQEQLDEASATSSDDQGFEDDLPQA